MRLAEELIERTADYIQKLHEEEGEESLTLNYWAGFKDGLTCLKVYTEEGYPADRLFSEL